MNLPIKQKRFTKDATNVQSVQNYLCYAKIEKHDGCVTFFYVCINKYYENALRRIKKWKEKEMEN